MALNQLPISDLIFSCVCLWTRTKASSSTAFSLTMKFHVLPTPSVSFIHCSENVCLVTFIVVLSWTMKPNDET